MRIKKCSITKLIALIITFSMFMLNYYNVQAAVTSNGYILNKTMGFCPYYGLRIYPDIYNKMNNAFVVCNGAAGKYNVALWTELEHTSVDYPNMSDPYNKIYTKACPNESYVGSTTWVKEKGYRKTADINFNMRYPFSASNDSKSYDLVSVLTHELGHVSGLRDIRDDKYSGYVMYAYTSKGRVVKNFSAEEKKVLYSLYH